MTVDKTVVEFKETKNTKEIIINHKRTRMVKDGEYEHGLQTTELKSLD